MSGFGGWHIKRRDGVEGPLIGFEMTQRARDGRLSRDDLVSEESSGPWVQASTVEMFFPAAGSDQAETGDVSDRAIDEIRATETSTTYVAASSTASVGTQYKEKRLIERRAAMGAFLAIGAFIGFRLLRVILSQNRNR